jgi:glycine oxidase
MSERADTIVLGGGIAGLCVARRLAQCGERVLLVEKRHLGAGASGAAAGLQEVVWTPRSEFQKGMAASYAGYPAFIDELVNETGKPIEFARTGSLHLGDSDEAEGRLRTRLEKLLRDGAPVRWLDQSALRERLGSCSAALRGGLFNEEARRIHPPDLLHALRSSLELRGVEVIENLERVHLVAGEGEPRVEVTTVEGSSRELAATRLIVCAGAWTSELLRDAGVVPDAEVVPIRGQMVEIEANTLAPFDCVLHLNDTYVIPRPDRNIWVGATVEDVGFDERVTDVGVDAMLAAARKFFPDLEANAIKRSWSGLRPKLLRRGGALLTVGEISVLAGHYRNGILVAPRDADLLVARLTGTAASNYWSNKQ